MSIRDRVKELRRVPASDLRPNPKNWRTHGKAQREALAAVLEEVGFAGAELARELPDGSLELIDGHLRAEAAAGEVVPVLVLDVTESEADKLLATFDPIGAMAGTNAAALDGLMRHIATAGEAVSDLLAGVAKRGGVLPGREAPPAPAATPETARAADPPPAATYPVCAVLDKATYERWREFKAVNKIARDAEALAALLDGAGC